MPVSVPTSDEFDALAAEVAALGSTVDDLGARVAGLEAAPAGPTIEDFDVLAARVAELEARPVGPTIEDFAALEARVAALEPRDYLIHPFGPDHYFNIRIGQDATLIPFGHEKPQVIRGEWDTVIRTVDAPLVPVYTHTGGWNATPRCDQTSTTVLTKDGFPAALPVTTFTMGNDWDNDNQCAAILMRDAEGVVRRYETQPFVFCSGTAYSQFTRPSYFGGRIDDQAETPEEGPDGRGIEAPGVGGTHGGSGMPAFGGSITPEDVDAGVIDHALKCVVNTDFYLSAVTKTMPRWPATRTDGNGVNGYGSKAKPGRTDGMRMGCLLTTPSDMTGQMLTDEGRMLARALYLYGVYVVDGGTAHDGVKAPTAFYFAIEQGPHGSTDERFISRFGHPFKATAGAWYEDACSLVQALMLVDDTSRLTVGGAGPRRG